MDVNIADPANGTLILINTVTDVFTFEYTPDANYFGPEPLSIEFNDSNTATATFNQSVDVLPVNDAPVAIADTNYMVNEDESITAAASILFNDTDEEADPLTAILENDVTNGTLTLNADGTFNYTPNANFNGSDSFTYFANDGTVNSTTSATVTITINSINDAPLITSTAPASATEGILYTYQLQVDDPDDLNNGVDLTFSLSNEPAGMTVSPTGLIEWTPAEGQAEATNITVTVADGGEDGAIPANEVFSLTVTAIENSPIALPQSVNLDEDTSLNILLTGIDPEGQLLTFIIDTLPANGTLEVSGTPITAIDLPFTLPADSVTYQPATNYFGPDTFDFYANDGTSDSQPAAISITIAPVNDIPLAIDQAFGGNENSDLTVTLSATDLEGDTLVFSIATPPASGTVSGLPSPQDQIANPQTSYDVTYTPNSGFFGQDTFAFIASDNEDSLPATVTINITPDPRSRTFTTTADFEEGLLFAISTETPDEITTKAEAAAFDFLWVPVYTKGTVARIDPTTGRVLGEYYANPEGATSPLPRSVAIDSLGNAWIGNLRDNSIIKITTPDSGLAVDRNNNGVIDTSMGINEMLPWSIPQGETPSVEFASDELIVLYIKTDVQDLRHVSVDVDNNVWVGGTRGGPWQLYDGVTGELIREEPFPNRGGYGGYFDPVDQVLYSTGNKFLRWNVTQPTTDLDPAWFSARPGAWGVAKDFEDNILVTRDGTRTTYKYASDGTFMEEFFHGYHYAQGITVDQNGHIWIAHSHCSGSVGHMLPDGTWLGNIPVAYHGPTEVTVDRKGFVWVSGTGGVVQRINPLGGPIGADGETPVGEVDIQTPYLGGTLWTYGDFSGNASALETTRGIWHFSFDGEIPGTAWGSITWNVDLCNDPEFIVEVRTSDDGTNFGEWETVAFEQAPISTGRYLEGRVSLNPSETGESPVLRDLTVGTAGYTVPEATRQWYVDAGEDIDGLWPDPITLRGAICKSAHDFTIEPTVTWELVSGPGTVDFVANENDVLQPTVNFDFSVIQATFVMRITVEADGEIKTDEVEVNLIPYNKAPYVNAGGDEIVLNVNTPFPLNGTVRDDGLPLPLDSPLTIQWSKKFGPGFVTFDDPSDPQTTASFSDPGVYLLQLTGSDGELENTDGVEVRVDTECTVNNLPGMVSWWQANCDAIDHVGANVGFLENYDDPLNAYVSGQVAAGIVFDGTDDRINVFASPSLDVGVKDGISWELWVKPDNLRNATLIQFANAETQGVHLRMTSSGSLVFDVYDDSGANHSLSTGSAFTAGSWSHIAAAYDRASGRAELYVNGQLRRISNLGSFIAETSIDAFFGNNIAETAPFDGVMDEITLFCRALNSEEVWDIYQSGDVGKCPAHTNLTPIVDAGGTYSVPNETIPINLNGSVIDDGIPLEGTLDIEWTVINSPTGSTVTFVDDTDPLTSVSVDSTGYYMLKLEATDGLTRSLDFATLIVGAYCEIETDDSLVGWWKGEENGSDSSINDNNGFFVNGSAYGNGLVGRSMSFSGTNNVRVPESSDLDLGSIAGGFTIEFWINPSRNAEDPVLSWNQEGTSRVSLIRRNGGSDLYLRAERDGGGVNDYYLGRMLGANSWDHVVIVYDRTLGQLITYNNGLEIYRQNLATSLNIRTEGELWIGRTTNDGSRTYFRGLLDELSFYDRPLLPEEVDALHSAGSVGKCLPIGNTPPTVFAGYDERIPLNSGLPYSLNGNVIDDGLPIFGNLQTSWNLIRGPVGATIDDETSPQTTVTFTTEGLYEFELVATDGQASHSDEVVIQVSQSCLATSLPSLVAWWSGNQNANEPISSNDGHPVRTTYTEGFVGSSFNFDGSGYVRVPESPELNLGIITGGFTIEFWINPSRNAEDPVLSWNQEGTSRVSLIRRNGGSDLYLRAQRDGGGVNDYYLGRMLGTNSWDHVVIVYDRTLGQLITYNNGLEIYRQPLATSLNIRTEGEFWIGRTTNDGPRTYFRGRLDEISLYSAPITAADVQAIYNAGSIGRCFEPSLNQAPALTAGPDRSVNLPQSQLTISAQTFDDGLPSGNDLTATWNGPAGVIFNPATIDFTNVGTTNFDTTINFPGLGIYALTLEVTDGELTSTDVINVTVNPQINLAPEIDLGTLPALITFGQQLNIDTTITDDDLPTGSTLAIGWSQVSGPGSASFAPDNTVEDPAISFDIPGVYTLRVEVTDGEFTTSENITVEVNEVPLLSLTSPAEGSSFLDTDTVTFTASASDTDGITQVEFFLNGAPLNTLTAKPFNFSQVLAPDNYILTAVATDGVGLQSTIATVNFTVRIEGSGSLTAEIITPVDAAEITEPTPIIGTANSADFDNYTLDYRLIGNSSWTTFADSINPVENGELGIFDPTLLRNGTYEVRLSAQETNGDTLIDTITYTVDIQMKVGHFTLTFEDLNVPVSGIPVQLLRTYDSRGALQGDFGLGWDLGMRSVQVYENRTLGENWEVDIIRFLPIIGTPMYNIVPTKSHVVTVVLGDSQVEQFEVVITSPENAFLAPASVTVGFEPINGSVGSLSLVDNSPYNVQYDGNSQAVGTPAQIGIFDPVDPSRYIYISPDGTEMEIEEILGLRKITDRNNNVLDISEDGITHSSGKSISFTRDAENRITVITDPNGNQLTYEYDVQGRLSRFYDREGNDPESELFGLFTEYRYENPNFPNYLTSIIDPRGIEAIASEYDDDGRLVGQTDADGNQIGFVHDIPNKREIITDRLGVQTIHEYDLNGNVVVTRTVDPNNPGGELVTQYAYDANDNETLVIDPLGNRTERAYDLANNNLLSETQRISDGAGGFTEITTTFTYDAFSNPTSIVDSRGNTTAFAYDAANGNLLSQTDAEGNVTTFAYDSAGNLTTMTDAEGNVTTNAYDSSGNLTASEVRDSISSLLTSSSFTYDNNGNQLTQTTLRTLYDDAGNVTGTENLLTQFEYDSENRVTRTTFPDGTFTTVTYNDFGKQATSTDQLGRTVAMFYDDRGNLVRTVYPDTTEESMTYDLENRRLSSTDRLGRTTYFVYDELGRMTDTIHPDDTMPSTILNSKSEILNSAELQDNPTSSTLYDEIGRVATSFDERGNPTLFAYDPECGCSGRRNTVTNALGQATNFAYDENGNQLSMTDANGHTTSFVYDDNNRPTRTTFHDGTFTETVYDSLNRRVAEIDQEGKRTEFGYDGLGRLIEVRQPHPDGIQNSPFTTHYSYDEVGNLIEQTDAEGRTTRYQYDSLGRRIKRILPEGESETMTYNANGTLATRTDFNGDTTTYLYDSLDRLIEKQADPTHPSVVNGTGPAFIVYTYDDAGQRKTATTLDSTRTILHQNTWTYDERGRVLSKGNDQGILSYTYDAVNNLTGVQSDNANGVDLNYSYDALNRLSTVLDTGASVPPAEHSYTYDDVGNLQTLTYQSGVTHTWTYNSLNRLTNVTISNQASQILNAFSYQLNASGHRAQMVEQNGRTVDYTYDDLYRLTEESISGDPVGLNGDVMFSYDKVGNRLTRISTVTNLNPQNFTYDANDRLDSDTYDANGNTLESITEELGGYTDEYDFENRLVKRTYLTGKTITIAYDADGNRIRKTVTDAPAATPDSTYYLVDTNNLTGYAQVVEELRDDGTGGLEVFRAYTYGLDLIAQHQLHPPEAPTEWRTSYYLYDGLGTVRALADENGAITDTYTYSAFGEILSSTSNFTPPTENLYLFTGEQYDPDLEMYFLRARYMDPAKGRFHNMDTFEGNNGTPLSLHKYLYGNGNPVSAIDPSGNSIFDVVSTAITIGRLAAIAFPRVLPALAATAKVSFATAAAYSTASAVINYSLSPQYRAQVASSPINTVMFALDLAPVALAGHTLFLNAMKYYNRAKGVGVLISSPSGNVVSGQVLRQGGRPVLNQGNSPSCGPTSCGMILNTVAPNRTKTIISGYTGITEKGVYLDKMADLLKANGLRNAQYRPLSIDALKQATARGNPAIVAVGREGGGHAIVVDGITKRGGQTVVAIRDPWGQQYFQKLEDFANDFLGVGITF